MSEDRMLEAESFKNIEVLPRDVELATTQSQRAVQCLSFIHSLPDDLIFEIFLIFVVQSNSAKALRSNPPSQSILSMICRRWRDIVTYSPLLWTDIFFPANPKYDTFFERSCPASINVNFDSVSSWLSDDAALPRFAQSLMKHISRLRSLTIIVRRMTDMREFGGTLESEALHLQTLNIRLYNSNCDDVVTTHTPLGRGGGSVRSLNIGGLCFHCLPLLSGLTKLEIVSVGLNSRDFQAILNNYPSLSTLVIGYFREPIQDLWAPLPDQTPPPAQVLAPSLRSLAIRIGDNNHSSECTCALPWLVMDNLEYLEIMFPLYAFNTHHASILSRLKSVPHLRKLRFYGFLEHILNSDKTFFSSLPKNADLECVYYPEPGHPALIEILTLPHFRSITFDLTCHLSSQFGHFTDLGDFVQTVSCTELKSPIIVHLPKNTPKLDAIESVLGDRISVHAFPSEKGLLDNYLFDYGEDGDDFELSLEDEIEEELADEFEYEFEDDLEEDEFGDESDGSEFQLGHQRFYASEWDIDGDSQEWS